MKNASSVSCIRLIYVPLGDEDLDYYYDSNESNDEPVRLKPVLNRVKKIVPRRGSNTIS